MSAVGTRCTRSRPPSRESMPSSTSPGRPSPAGSPAPTSRRCANSRVGPTRAMAVRCGLHARRAGDHGGGVRHRLLRSRRGRRTADRGEPAGHRLPGRRGRGVGGGGTSGSRRGKRVVNVRTGIVQSARGGAWRYSVACSRPGWGDRWSSGSQWVSWIGLDDLLDVYGRSLGDEALEGPLNVVAPEPVTNRQYARILAGVLHRPALVPVPPDACSSAPREHAVAGGRASVWSPTVWRPGATSTGNPTLEACLRHELGHVDEPLPGESLGSSPS